MTLELSLNNPHLLMEASTEELRGLIRGREVWSEMDARLLDQVLKARVLDALASSRNLQELEEVRQLVTSSLLPSRKGFLIPSSEGGKGHVDRNWVREWAAWGRLLDGRISQLQARDPERLPYRLARKKPSRQILRILEDHRDLERPPTSIQERVAEFFLRSSCEHPLLGPGSLWKVQGSPVCSWLDEGIDEGPCLDLARDCPAYASIPGDLIQG